MPAIQPQADATDVLLEFLYRLGQAYLASGEQTPQVELTLRRIATAYGMRNARVVAFPTALFITVHDGKSARVFQSTMGSGNDLENPGLRRLIINASYWCMGMETAIKADRSVDIVGTYKPLESGFNYEELGVVPNPVNFYK